MPKTWLEAALSGPWSRKNQPRIPITVAEIVADGIAAANEGAAIIHVHPYDEATGRQKDDADIYARIIEGIRAKVDVIVYPTLPSDPQPGSELSGVGAHRHAPVEELARRGLIEWSLVDPGSVNLSGYDEIAQDKVGSVYLNVESDARAGFATAEHYGLRPSCAVFEPGFIRLGAALAARFPRVKTPLYRLMFSEGYTFGFPPKLYGLEAHLATLADNAPHAPWMVGGLRCDITPLIEAAVNRGGHVRVGLEDMAYGCDRSNADLVAAGAREILRAGGR
jgi:uncharacterized protein (DUF849 family)